MKHQTLLNSFIDNFKMVYVEMENGIFTWNNRRGGIHMVASRLDHFLTSKDLLLSSLQLDA